MEHHWLKFHSLSNFQRKLINTKKLNASLVHDPSKPFLQAKQLKLSRSEKNALREIFDFMGDSADVYEASF